MRTLLLCVFFSFAAVLCGAVPNPVDAFAVEKMNKRVSGMIIPRIEFREAGISEIFAHLTRISKELDPDKIGVQFQFTPEAKKSQAIITLTLNEVPLIEVLKYVTNLSNLLYKVTDTRIVISDLNGK